MRFMPSTMRPRRRPERGRERLSIRGGTGFTLIEVALCTILVGFGVAATMQLFATGTLANVQSAQLTTATHLGNALHEATLRMEYADVIAMDGQTYSPPIDAAGSSIASLGSSWQQHVSVSYVDPADLTHTLAIAQPMARVTVTVSHHQTTVYTSDWIIAQPQ